MSVGDVPAPAPNPAPTDILDTPQAGSAVMRGGTLRFVAYVTGIVVSIGSVAVLTRHLGLGDYGRYSAVFSLITIVAGLSEAGMTNAAVREYTIREGAERDRIMRAVLGLRLALTAVGVAVSVGFALAAGYNGELILGTVLAGLGVVMAVLSGTLGVPLQAGLRLGWVSALESLRAILTAAGLIALAVAGAGLAVLLAVPLPVGVVVLAVTAVLVRGSVPLRPSFEPAAWRELFALMVPFAVVTAVGVLYGYLALPLVSLVSTEQETGLFGASFRVFVVLSGVPGLLAATAFPLLARAARDDHVRLGYALDRMFQILLMLAGLMTVATLIGASVAISIIADAEFARATDVLRIQALGLVPTSLVGLWGFALLSLHRTRGMLIGNGLALVVSVGTVLALAPGHGAQGAAVASVLGETVIAVSYGIALLWHDPGLRPSLGILPRVAAAGALAAVPALALSLAAVPETLLSIVIYLVALVALGAVPDEVWDAVCAIRARLLAR